MRVAFVAHQFFPAFYTGVERLTLNLATQLGRMGHECIVVAPADRSGGSEQPYPCGGTWVRPVEADRVGVSQPWNQEPAVRERLEQVLAEEEPELVHVMQPLQLPSAFHAARRRRLPVVTHIADFGYLCTRTILRRRDGSLCVGADDGRACTSACGIPVGPQRVRWGRAALKEAAAVITPCRFTRDVFASQGFDTRHWHHVPWGTDYSLHPTRLPGPKRDVLTIGFLGTLIEHKGALTLVEAMRLLPDRPIELRLYGESFHEPEYEQRLQEVAEGDERIRFEGRYDQDSFTDLLPPLDAVAIPSLWHENLPTVGLNAAAAGVPVIGSDVGGIRELIDDYRCGFTFRTGRAESLAELLDGLERERAVLSAVRERMGYPPGLEEEAWAVNRIYTEVIEGAPRPRRRSLRIIPPRSK